MERLLFTLVLALMARLISLLQAGTGGSLQRFPRG